MATDNYREALELTIPDTSGGETTIETSREMAWELLVQIAAALRVTGAPAERFEAVYRIPGTFSATYAGTLEAGEITRLTFTPAASDAGYFGPAVELWTGDTAGPAGTLLLEACTDSIADAFWRAVRVALQDIGEQPKSPENPYTIHRVPIEWTE